MHRIKGCDSRSKQDKSNTFNKFSYEKAREKYKVDKENN